MQPHAAVLRRRPLTVLCGLALCGVLAITHASEDELMGFIVDNCISHIGHEFYRYFSDRLRDTSPLDFNLVVRERPSARWGSLIWVEFDGRVVFRQFFAPNTAHLRELAYQSADLVREEVARQRLERLLQDTQDLERDEL